METGALVEGVEGVLLGGMGGGATLTDLGPDDVQAARKSVARQAEFNMARARINKHPLSIQELPVLGITRIPN